MAADKYSPSKEIDKKSNETILDIDDRHFLFSCMKLSTLDKFAIFFAEVIGTGLLLFLGCAGCIAWDAPPPSMYPSFTFGMAVMLVIISFGSISGAHLNPAVTVAAVCYKIISVQMSVIYIVAQVIGSFLGFGLLKLLTPPHIFRPETATGAGICSTVPHEDMTALQTFALEFFATMGLIFVCCGVWDPRSAKSTDSTAIKFGLTVTVLSLGFGPFTGCSMNPARTLGPAIWNGDFAMHWVYWLAPLLSGALTTLLYKALFWRDVPKTEAEEFSLSLVQNNKPSS